MSDTDTPKAAPPRTSVLVLASRIDGLEVLVAEQATTITLLTAAVACLFIATVIAVKVGRS